MTADQLQGSEGQGGILLIRCWGLEVRAGETCVWSTRASASFCAPHSTLGNLLPSGRDMCLKVARILEKSVGRNKTDVKVNIGGIAVVVEDSLYL